MIHFLAHLPNWLGVLLFFAVPLAAIFTLLSWQETREESDQ